MIVVPYSSAGVLISPDLSGNVSLPAGTYFFPLNTIADSKHGATGAQVLFTSGAGVVTLHESCFYEVDWWDSTFKWLIQNPSDADIPLAGAVTAVAATATFTGSGSCLYTINGMTSPRQRLRVVLSAPSVLSVRTWLGGA
jgi:hypothetical protein